MKRFFGTFAVMFVSGSAAIAYAIFTPGTQLLISALGALLTGIGAQGMRAGWRP